MGAPGIRIALDQTCDEVYLPTCRIFKRFTISYIDIIYMVHKSHLNFDYKKTE